MSLSQNHVFSPLILPQLNRIMSIQSEYCRSEIAPSLHSISSFIHIFKEGQNSAQTAQSGSEKMSCIINYLISHKCTG